MHSLFTASFLWYIASYKSTKINLFYTCKYRIEDLVKLSRHDVFASLDIWGIEHDRVFTFGGVLRYEQDPGAI